MNQETIKFDLFDLPKTLGCPCDLRRDSFKIFSDQIWEESSTGTSKVLDFSNAITKFESSSFCERDSNSPGYAQDSSQVVGEDEISLSSKDSRLQQASVEDFDFFGLEKPEASNYFPHNVKEKTDGEMLSEIPKVDSFINPKEQESFYTSLIDAKTKGDFSLTLEECSKSSRRIRRWLKDEDRKLIHLILELKSKSNILEDEFRADIATSADCKNLWTFVKNSLHTSRSVEFLQTRYFKLLKNQKLNTKERMLLADKYDSMSIEQLMVRIPGKSKETLTKLIKEFEAKDTLSKLNTELSHNQIETKRGLISLDSKPTACFSMISDKEVWTNVDTCSALSSPEFLKKIGRKSLKRLSYSLNQLIGEIYAKTKST